VFGSEESGLPNEILLKANVGVTIPMATVYPSLNLSQAVMTIAYELSQGAERVGSKDEKDRTSGGADRAGSDVKDNGTRGSVERRSPGEEDEPGEAAKAPEQESATWQQLQERTNEILKEAGIHPPTPLYHRIIERMSMMKASDARLAHSVTSRIIELLKNSYESGREK
jgi:hypothetical protein